MRLLAAPMLSAGLHRSFAPTRRRSGWQNL